MHAVSTRVGAGLALAAALGLGLFLAVQAVFASVPTGNAYAVDAVPGGAITSSVTVPVGGSFTIDTVITASPDPRSAEQSNVSFNPGVIGYVSGPVETNLGGAVLCGTGTVGLGFVYNGCALAAGTTSLTGVTRSWTLECLAPGTSALHLVTDAEAGGPALGTNFAIAAGEAEGPLTDASVTCVLPISKTNNTPASVPAGTSIQYTVHVGNPTALSVGGLVVGDIVPAPLNNVAIVSSTNGALDGCSVAVNTVLCVSATAQPDPVGFDLVISADIPLSAAGTNNICNFAQLGPPSGPVAGDDCVNVNPSGLTITKSPAAPKYAVGDTITWNITVTSSGGSTATGVMVVDTPTDGFTLVTAPSSGACIAGPLGTWNCGDMAPGASENLTVTGTVIGPPADVTCNNSVAASSTNGPGDAATAATTCVSKDVRMIKDTDGDLDEASEAANLWLCEGVTCVNNGEGFLDINETVLNVSSAVGGVGAFEFQLKYDHKIFDVSITEPGTDGIDNDGDSLIDEADEQWLYSTGRVPGAPGIGGCAATVVTENYILFGCVSKNPAPPAVVNGVTVDGVAAIIHVEPDPDLSSRITPGNNNGVVRTVLNENCELADIWGHPLTDGTFDALGRPNLLPGIVDGGLVEDCADITITVRILEGDLNLDCEVDVTDDQAIASRYGSFFGNLSYQPWYDLEPAIKDFDVDIKDLQKVFGRNGSTCALPIPAQDPQQDPGSSTSF